MKKGILFGGMGLALFAAGIFFFANSGTGNVSASGNDKSVEVVKSDVAPTCGCNGAGGASCSCSSANGEAGKGCSANGGSCGCSANGGAGKGKELRGASIEEKNAARAERQASCGCKK